MSNPSEANWDRLIAAHEKMDERQDAIYKEMLCLQREAIRIKK
jgi:hypothetical protein